MGASGRLLVFCFRFYFYFHFLFKLKNDTLIYVSKCKHDSLKLIGRVFVCMRVDQSVAFWIFKAKDWYEGDKACYTWIIM